MFVPIKEVTSSLFTLAGERYTKKECAGVAEALLADLYEDGYGTLEILALARRLADVGGFLLKEAIAEALPLLAPDEETDCDGISVTATSQMRYKFDHAPAWVEADQRKKEIEKAMRAAARSNMLEAADPETGEVLPAAQRAPTNPFIKMSY